MAHLSDHYMQRAQNSKLSLSIPRDRIPEFLRLATLPQAVLRLLHPTGDVIEIAENDAPAFFTNLRSARTYMQQVPPEYRESIVSTISTSSSASYAPSNLSDLSRNSFASTNTTDTDLSFAPSISSVRYQKKPKVVPTCFERAKVKGKKPQGTFMCPSCGVQCVHPWDLKKHIQNICEKQKTFYKCNGCYQMSEDREYLRKHRLQMHQNGIPTEGEFSPEKKAFGCAFCANVHHSLDAYIKCVQTDQTRDPAWRPSPRRRLIALWRQSPVTEDAMMTACLKRDLQTVAWTWFTWDDDVCDEYSNQLEYGCYGPDDIYKNGVALDNLTQFAENLVLKARYESTGMPVEPPPPPPPPPPPKDNTVAIRVSPPRPAQRFGDSIYHENEKVDGHNVHQFYRTHRTTPITMGFAEHKMLSALTSEALQQQTENSWQNNTTPKRQPSVDSTAYAERSFPAKRNPAIQRLAPAERNSDRPDSVALPADILPVGICPPPHMPAATGPSEQTVLFGEIGRSLPKSDSISSLLDSYADHAVEYDQLSPYGPPTPASYIDDGQSAYYQQPNYTFYKPT